MPDRGDTLIAGSIVSLGIACTAFWSGAHLAAFLSGAAFGGRWARSPIAVIHLAQDHHDLGGAWDTNSSLTGSPVLYWVCTGFTLTLAAGVIVTAMLVWMRPTVGINRSKRLGLVPESRMATKAEMAPLLLKKPVDGRFSFGRVMGNIVATEDPDTQTARQIRNRKKTRVGDRTSVMVFGASRSGKTSNIVPGVLEWDHPAIISSVKADLMQDTLARRRQIGEVFLFDPFDVAPAVQGVTRVAWSPISCANTISGAIDAAQTLADAASAKDTTNAGYWTDRAVNLLWPILFTASIDNRSMRDVLRWLALQDGADPDSSEVMRILARAMAEGGSIGLQAALAYSAFEGWTKLDTKPRSEQNSTSQSLVSCWSDPYAAASSDPALVQIDMAKILSGRNTLYIVQPLGRGTQFAPLFGGLFGDLIRDQTYRIAQAAGGRARIGPVLALLDEAGNTPLRWLPQVASTCAGIGVQLVTIWQDRSQIESIYGVDTQSILNNHQTKLFFAGQSDQVTMDYASMLCGEEEVTSTSASADLNLGSGRRSESAAPVTKRLVPADLIRLMPTGTALLIHNTLPPVHLDGRRVSEEPQLHARERGEGPLPVPLVIDPQIEAAFGAGRADLPDRVVAYMASTQASSDTSFGAIADSW